MALDFFAGCLGGCAGVLVGYPLDTIKVRLQTQDSKCPRYSGMINCFTTIIRKEKVTGLYKGMSSPLAGIAFINALIFGVYGNVQRRLSPESLLSVAVAGSIAGVAQSVICCPMELIKLRMQIQEDLVKQSALSPRTKTVTQKYKNSWDCATKIYHREGCKGFFRGFGITAVREAPAFGIYFTSYEWLVSIFQEPSSSATDALPILLAGGLSGICSWVFTYPIDVVKTRLQADGEDGRRQYKNTVDCLVKSYKNEGLPVFSRGLLSTVVRAFPTNAATFVVVSWTFRLFNNKNHNLQDSKVREDHKRLLHDGKKFEDIKPMSEFNTFIA